MNIYEILKNKKDKIIQIAKNYGAYNVRIFGSVARGQADEKSDIDFLVDLEEGRTILDLGGLWNDLNELLEIRVEVFTENTLKPKIRANILKEAKTL
jgi:hypothetical protein